MQPLDNLPPDDTDDEDLDNEDDFSSRLNYRGATEDPLFGLLLVGAISLGLIPLNNSGAAGAADMRYTLVWGLMAGFGVLAWLFGNSARIAQEKPEDVAWGVAFGLILAVPLLAVAGGSLREAAELLFPNLRDGTLLTYVVFVMPLAESLFFRGVLQQNHNFWQTGLFCTAWNLVLFFPLMNVGPYPLIMGVILLMANLMYGYVRDRNGLAAAWVCQITVNLVILFLPFATR